MNVKYLIVISALTLGSVSIARGANFTVVKELGASSTIIINALFNGEVGDLEGMFSKVIGRADEKQKVNSAQVYKVSSSKKGCKRSKGERNSKSRNDSWRKMFSRFPS
ncbi:hypothetical protein BAnh1_01790 [Bartonella australis AUST/NH1]|uniref:Uncharacterized protein n=1 Tax=Bartonella australis (strain Aust/NH1) TaxID=1094489 RepID=M1PBR0_BARAA|nr:hypothetical protein BAnh1_01790 [Bartonella australis AUST/NH1]